MLIISTISTIPVSWLGQTVESVEWRIRAEYLPIASDQGFSSYRRLC